MNARYSFLLAERQERKMALTANVAGRLSSQLFKQKVYLYSGVRCYSTDKSRLRWNHLWVPEEYKKENHAKHAEKYHMHPDEYEPYDNPTKHPTGDYPKLPWIGPASKDPFYPYDIPSLRKNYHEPMHDKFEMMSEDRYSFGHRYRINPHIASLIYFGVMAGFALFFWKCSSPYPIMLEPSMARQYPYDGNTYYTFELEK